MKKTKFVNQPRGGYRLGSGKDNFMNTVQVESPGRNYFDLSHTFKFTGRIANLMPCLVHEAVPGDKFNISCDILTRVAPMIAPIMDRMDVRVEYFFSPNRIVWPDSGANQGWQKFISNESGITRPFITLDNTISADEMLFLDYWRIPPFPNQSGGAVSVNIQCLPFAHYQKIYCDYYRPQYLENENVWELGDGDQNAIRADLFTMRRRCYDNDYFTANLPTPQKGAEVQIPGGAVTFDATGFGATAPTFRDNASASFTGDLVVNASDEINATPSVAILGYDPAGTLNAPAIGLNELREANALQKWLEMLNRVGSRYKELIRGAFGITVEDFRLDRPEFITGVKDAVTISEVLNTTGDTGAGDPLPQGNMAGHGISVIEGYQDSYFVKEHGYIIGIISVMPKATYMEGIDRHWLRDSPNDWYWPHFANLGEQGTLNIEVQAYNADQLETFGYMPRYSELRTIRDGLAGNFRNNLQFWTLTRDFVGVTPNLNREFLDVNEADVTRIFAAGGSDDYFYFHVLHKVGASRLIPVYGTPQLI